MNTNNAIPESNADKEKQEEPERRFFRNQNDKIVGGVCSGIAHTLNIDPLLVRILFAFFLLGCGASLILYIILWIVLPEKALTQNITQSQSRAVGIKRMLLTLIKVFFYFLASIFLFSAIVTLGVLTLGFVWTIPYHDFLLSNDFQHGLLWSILLLFLITPLAGIIVWIIRKIIGAKKNRYLSIAFGVLWTGGWIALFAFLASFSRDWKDQAFVATSLQRNVNDSAILRITVSQPERNPTSQYDWLDMEKEGIDITEDSLFYHNVSFKVEKSQDSLVRANILKYSYGTNENSARAKAKNIVFNAVLNDRFFMVDDVLGIDKKDRFRLQRVKIILALPAGQKIRFDEKFTEIFEDWEEEENGEEFEFDYDPDIEYIMTETGLKKGPLL